MRKNQTGPPTRSWSLSSSRARGRLVLHDDNNNFDSDPSSEEEDEEEGITTIKPSISYYCNKGKEKVEEGISVWSSSEGCSNGNSIKLKKKEKVCKVCKSSGHEAGFVGATYVDCPKKPCFLCKLPGHTTISCPHRVAALLPSHPNNTTTTTTTTTTFSYVFRRQLQPHLPMLNPKFVIPNQLHSGLIRFHSRRVTCLEFHPTNTAILLSGDKKGQLGIWNHVKLHENTIYGSIHSCILNHMRFNPLNDGTIYTSSSDGTTNCTDLETGEKFLLMDLNPDGWHGPASWRMLYGLDVNSEKGLLLVADNFGYLHLLDARTKKITSGPILIHKKGSKVVGLHCNPLQPDLLLSCGNDHFARLWDIRRITEGSSLSNLPHGRVVNSAYFSPRSGIKILTTSQDNRIRVWDSIFGNLEQPSREIVHSHDFNRHLTPFRAEWDPKDPSESLAVIGRYISENYNGVALHPVDFIDTSTGQLAGEVTEADITTISPVNKLHPTEDILATGSSRSLFIWKPKGDSDGVEQKQAEKSKQFIFSKLDKNKSLKKFEDESDDDGDFSSKIKKSKMKK